MTDMTPDEARAELAAHGPADAAHMIAAAAPDLAFTVEQQAAQIERLQAALRDADRWASTEPGATWEEDFPMLNEGDMDDDQNNR